MSIIKYRGAIYRLADVPANMEPTSAADPKALVPDKKDLNEREITTPEKPSKQDRRDPLIDVAIAKLEKRVERLRTFTLPTVILEKLIHTHDLPSAQLLISDWKTSKERLVKKIEEVLEELGKEAK